MRAKADQVIRFLLPLLPPRRLDRPLGCGDDGVNRNVLSFADGSTQTIGRLAGLLKDSLLVYEATFVRVIGSLPHLCHRIGLPGILSHGVPP